MPGVVLSHVDDHHHVQVVLGNKLKDPPVHLFNVVAGGVSELFIPEESIEGEIITVSDSANSDNARIQQNQDYPSSQAGE